MRSRTPPISSEFQGGGLNTPNPPSVRHWCPVNICWGVRNVKLLMSVILWTVNNGDMVRLHRHTWPRTHDLDLTGLESEKSPEYWLCCRQPTVTLICNGCRLTGWVGHAATLRVFVIINYCTLYLTIWRLTATIWVVPHSQPPDAAFYIFIQQIYVLNILNMLHKLLFFSLFKMPFIS